MKIFLSLTFALMVVAGCWGLIPDPACADNGCPTLACNDSTPCPGSDCGCVVRPGQPWGTCQPFAAR